MKFTELNAATSSINTERIDHVYEEPHVTSKKFVLHYGDLTDGLSCINILSRFNQTKYITWEPRATLQ